MRKSDAFERLINKITGANEMNFGYTVKETEEDAIILSVSCWADVVNTELIAERGGFDYICARMFDGMYEIALIYSEGDFDEHERFLKSVCSEYDGGLLKYSDDPYGV